MVMLAAHLNQVNSGRNGCKAVTKALVKHKQTKRSSGRGDSKMYGVRESGC